MEDMIKVRVPMFATLIDVTAEFREQKPVSGMDYLLVRMVDYGNRLNTDQRISDLIGLFSISSDLLPLVLNELHGLVLRKVLRSDVEKVTKDTFVKKMGLTDLGRTVCDTGLVPRNAGQLAEQMMYFPGRSVHFSKVLDLGDVKERKPAIEPYEGDVKDFVKANRGLFGLTPQAEVSKVGFSTEKTQIYRQELVIGFDGSTGELFVDAERSGIDLTYMMIKVGGKAVADGLPSDVFDTPERSLLGIGRWTQGQREEGWEATLPIDFDVPGGLVLFDPQAFTRVDAPVCCKAPGLFGSDLSVVTSEYEGRCYRFVAADVPLRGFNVAVPGRLVLSRRLSSDEISQCLCIALEGLDISRPEELRRINDISRSVQDSGILTDRVMSALPGSDLEAMSDILSSLAVLGNRLPRVAMERKLEEHLCSILDDGTSLQFVEDYLEVCGDCGLPIAGRDLLSKLFEVQDYLKVLDWACVSKDFRQPALSHPGTANHLMSAIVSDSFPHVESDFCSKAAAAGKALASLRAATGIADVAGYTLDLDGLFAIDGEAFLADLRTLNDSLSSIAKSVPSVREDDDYDRVQAMVRLYNVIAIVFKSKKAYHSRKDIASEENILLFCHNLHAVLRSQLDLVVPSAEGVRSQLDSLSGRVGDQDLSDIREFLDSEERFAIHEIDHRFDPAVRSKWVEAVFRLGEL